MGTTVTGTTAGTLDQRRPPAAPARGVRIGTGDVPRSIVLGVPGSLALVIGSWVPAFPTVLALLAFGGDAMHSWIDLFGVSEPSVRLPSTRTVVYELTRETP